MSTVEFILLVSNMKFVTNNFYFLPTEAAISFHLFMAAKNCIHKASLSTPFLEMYHSFINSVEQNHYNLI